MIFSFGAVILFTVFGFLGLVILMVCLKKISRDCKVIFVTVKIINIDSFIIHLGFFQNRHNRNDGGERFVGGRSFATEWNQESNQTSIRVVVVPQYQPSQPPQPEPSIATISDEKEGLPTYDALFPDVSRNDQHI